MSEPDVSTGFDGRVDYELTYVKPEDIEFEHVTSEEEDYESGPAYYEIATYPADFTLEVLNKKWQAGDIKIPPFQRQFVWKQVQASKLIESFLVGLPVPSIFLYTERQSQKFLVIDGQQRLKSVFYYFEGYFGEEKGGKRDVFQLKGLSDKSKYHLKEFRDLDEPDQRKLKNSVLRSFIVQQLAPDDDTSIYHIFERLNTGGTLLSNQEVRNCVYGGHLNNLIHQFNDKSEWRSILGKPVPDSRQRDVELILRFFALLDISGYEKPMKDYLSKFLRRNQNPSKETLKDFSGLFEGTCSTVVGHLGAKPFHVRAGLNAAVFDCVMVAFAKHLGAIPPDIRDRYGKLKNREDFNRATSVSTTDIDIVKARFGLAEGVLFSD